MSTASVRPSSQEVRKRAEQIKRRIEAKFPNVNVDVADWNDLIGENRGLWEHRGFPLPRPWVHAYLLIQGDQETTEEAAALADSEVARLLEETNVVIEIKRTARVVCKKSEVPTLGLQPRHTVISDHRGILFVCISNDHELHDWGRLKPQG
ncbi:MAG: hypothetical protein HYY02_09220 [Chloroflexi bacterium]|nr:hypothetical protein [Chloroflexota bacterium]